MNGSWAGLLCVLSCLALPCMELVGGQALAQETLTQSRLMIYAGPLYREYLGCLNCDQYDTDSVWNAYSPLGWGNSYSDYSHFYIYRQAHGVYSACDPFARQPPRILDVQNKLYGYLNISKIQQGSICGPKGVRTICDRLTAMCEQKNSIVQ
ncbi:MAG: hypothetical protein ABF990_07715 [Acetobacter sp.]|uniref:hypothetical protein n=1 Tax=Acetobacter sp. TaxID=440 RepID=UPI0039E8E0DC